MKKKYGILLWITVSLTGCGKQTQTSVLPPLMEQWQKGEKEGAIKRFVDTDWSARPLFTSGTTMGMSEEQFQKLSVGDIDAKIKEVMPQVKTIREMVQGVMEAGKDAQKKNDETKARKHFTAVKQCGQSIENSNSLKLVQLIGSSIAKMADSELAKLKP